MKSLLLAGALLCAAGTALAEDQKPAAGEPKPAPEPRRPLNLRLDNPSQYVTEEPVEKSGTPAGALPSLGADARTLPSGLPATTSRPFPKDTERGER